MVHLRLYMTKLYSVNGGALFLNIGCMIIVSLLEGFGIYMLVPMLAAIGVFVGHSGMPFLSGGLEHFLPFIPKSWLLPGMLMVFIVLLTGQALLQRYQSILNSRIQQRFMRSLRIDVYTSFMKAQWAFYLRQRKSDFSHVMTTELARVSQGTNLLLQLTTAVMFTMIQIALAFWLSPSLTGLVFLSGLGLFVVFRRSIRNAKQLGDRTTELSQVYFAGITDHMNGMKDIKSNLLEAANIHWFRSLTQRMEDNTTQFVRQNATTQFFHRTAAAVFVACVIFTSLQWLHVTPEKLIVLILIFSRLWPRFALIQASLEYIMSMISAFESVTKVQQECEAFTDPSLIVSASVRQPLSLRHGIECSHLDYRYDGAAESALRQINLFIPARGMTAIVGKSGAGKSTMVDVLMGFLRPTGGQITIDGLVLDDELLLQWRQSFGYVSQDPFLFHATVRENLMLADKDASEQQLWEALHFAAADNFVSRLPEGLDTVIGDRGIRLSGGERQRLVLARAVLHHPSVLILDEATSALDGEHEAAIQAALERMKGQMTLIVIAHRLSTIRHADQIVVLDQGEVIQQGNYHQLEQEERGAFSQLLSYQSSVTATP
ncbi:MULTISPECIES: ABC transporter ATP-binding protein [Paenibacillus]|uniref:ABC transporter ATP-binding protein n=1 Tax=Paenibacillus polymyxa TaxID=1406 RepID=A0AAP3ZW98_PAEPO|nr:MULTISPECIES: ABC transporter ATP-binding protein [Paenibacillus]APB77094.1 lipid A ABC transporter ATP-binding protein/permease MsbA [Paenibacillus polymyxa]MDH2330223.1 ABC transporter ATP-binding protein [Paenibacillus polymyxa]OMF34498.1 multidrug ABC transporter [Paenibacillus peoriae]OMF82802.1 multidrug ABC transporter [Paenibacillus peoriae]POR30279.1 ABC transporter ATP-binding protein [Paenibacillus polymyxa]